MKLMTGRLKHTRSKYEDRYEKSIKLALTKTKDPEDKIPTKRSLSEYNKFIKENSHKVAGPNRLEKLSKMWKLKKSQDKKISEASPSHIAKVNKIITKRTSKATDAKVSAKVSKKMQRIPEKSPVQKRSRGRPSKQAGKDKPRQNNKSPKINKSVAPRKPKKPSSDMGNKKSPNSKKSDIIQKSRTVKRKKSLNNLEEIPIMDYRKMRFFNYIQQS